MCKNVRKQYANQNTWAVELQLLGYNVQIRQKLWEYLIFVLFFIYLGEKKSTYINTALRGTIFTHFVGVLHHMLLIYFTH